MALGFKEPTNTQQVVGYEDLCLEDVKNGVGVRSEEFGRSMLQGPIHEGVFQR